ncbi:MAG: hypothetical protein ACFFAJ_06130 [Candidatus Hodarchaeota archaeon]
MVLNKKTRRTVILLVVGIAACSFLINQLLLEIKGMIGDINPKDIYLFQKDYTSVYRYEPGIRDVQQELILTSTVLNETHTNVTIEYDNKIESFLSHPNGTVYQDGVIQGNYSIWWIYVPNVLMMFGANAGDKFSVIDPTGFLGKVNWPYDLVVTRKRTYWPNDLELSNLLGAQSSFDAKLYNNSDDRLIAKMTFDITCGIIEVWEGFYSPIELTLKSTNFPMSRNRITGIIIESTLGSIIILVTFTLMSVSWNNQFLSRFTWVSKEERNEITLLLIAGVIAIIIEMIDIWFYLPLGLFGNIGLHAGYTVFLGFICWKQRYRYQWLVPSFLEIGFILALNFVTGDPYVPPLTAFMGSTISWIALVWASGIEKYQN